MNKETLISIVIPVYNAASYLRETVHSVCMQTYGDWEVIFVDDVSTDESVRILEQCKAEWEQTTGKANFRIIKAGKNGGPAAARNIGIDAAKGRYLTYLDADDLWDKDKLEKQIAFMRQKDCAFSFTGYEFADESGKRNGQVVHVPKEITYKEALKNTTISTITVMFDRNKIPTEVLKMPEDCAREDTATWWQILKNGYVAYGLDEPLAVYRRHADSHSSNKLKAVIGTWHMYRKQEQMSVGKSLVYFSIYLFHAVRRRI